MMALFFWGIAAIAAAGVLSLLVPGKFRAILYSVFSLAGTDVQILFQSNGAT